jgi:hypothetical protein
MIIQRLYAFLYEKGLLTDELKRALQEFFEIQRVIFENKLRKTDPLKFKKIV